MHYSKQEVALGNIFPYHPASYIILNYYVPPGYKIAQYKMNVLSIGYRRVSLVWLV